MGSADKDANPQAASTPASPFASLFGINIIALTLVGLAVSVWLLYYTDVFPQVAGILAFGGVATWVGFVLKLAGEKRMNELQAWTDTAILNSPRTVVFLAFLGLALVVAGNFRGGIQLEPLQESVEHAVQIHPAGKPGSSILRLLPSSPLRWTGWTCWWSPANIVVKVSGYPEAIFQFRPWQRISVFVPNSMLRPVVLLRPSVPLIDAIRDTSVKLELVIKESGRLIAQPEALFDGHALWVGGDEDILVPQEIESGWRQELATLNSIKHLDFLLPPVAPPQFNVPLQSGQEIQVTLRKKDKSVYTLTRIKVRPLRSSREFVQEVMLDVPPSNP
ncbi:MAG TPA: hypothetical protein VE398_12070 [Acidobacteriota bacterium]|nr:hypothetical protein [Acidobacteriota bacterium]